MEITNQLIKPEEIPLRLWLIRCGKINQSAYPGRPKNSKNGY